MGKQKFNYGSTSGTDRTDIKSYLEDMKNKDKSKYDAIMAGEEGVETTDGRKVIYAGKKSNVHSAAVVGDPLNIVMKLMAIISVVFADFFMSTNHGNGLFCAGELPGGCFRRLQATYCLLDSITCPGGRTGRVSIVGVGVFLWTVHARRVTVEGDG